MENLTSAYTYTGKGGDSSRVYEIKMEPTEESNIMFKPGLTPGSCSEGFGEIARGHRPGKDIPRIEIKKEDIDLIEKAAEVLDARSREFRPNIEYLAISDSPLSLVKNAKNAFQKAMNSAYLTKTKGIVGNEFKVKARTRLQSKFSPSNTAQLGVIVDSQNGEVDPDSETSVPASINPPQEPQFSSVTPLGCLLTASSDYSEKSRPSHSFTNDAPLDLTTVGMGLSDNTHASVQQALSTSTIACDVLQAMVESAAEDLKASKSKEEKPEGRTIEIHLYSEPKSVIQHRNRCKKKSQVEKTKAQIGRGKESVTKIQLPGNMSSETSDTLVRGQHGRRMYITEKQIQKVQKQCGSTERPPYSYLHLIQMAINSKPDRRMTLREIYDWMETTFPYFKHSAKPGWKNSIRHNLSLYDIFVRETCFLGDEKKKKASFWTLKVSEVPDEDVHQESENVDAEANSFEPGQQISVSAVRKYRSTPRPICPKGKSGPLPLYNDIVVGVPPSQQQPGHVPLLPKPTGDTFTLIPVQGMVPVPQKVHPVLPSCTVTSPSDLVMSEDSNSCQGFEPSFYRNDMDSGINDFTHLKRRRDSGYQMTGPKQPRIFSPNTPGFQYSSCEYDSGIDLKSVFEKSSCSDFSPLPVEDTHPKQKRVRAPRKPRQPKKSQRLSAKIPHEAPHKENHMEKIKTCRVEGKIPTYVGSGLMSSSDAGFTSPLRDTLNTPPRKDMLATSTPVKNNFLSPKWCSPVSFQTVTPVRNANEAPNISDTLATPSLQHFTDLSFGFSVSPEFNSPKNCKLKGRSLGLNVGGDNSFTGMTGLTPLKPKDGNISGLSVNDSLGRILGDMQFDEQLLGDGGVMPFVDVKDLSWLAH